MSTTPMDGTASPEEIKGQVQQAVDEFEDMQQANIALHQDLESGEWENLDGLAEARMKLDQARDALAAVAEKVGLAQGVSEARAANRMVGNKSSLGRD
ncbi:putative coiled-coil protein SlyX [Prauserella isguenensis]|uniref:Putative coiled-coil protein SlyX n=1 Tax=Prauserella isguenensis TaxID=1470180 RepID=A0A839S6R6_9PSEU|nr:hypothetical protein [Prauserella isguenensis]MBB3053565.1 putative coiled-coil protein SlyX [Prauserella isguenensis]